MLFENPLNHPLFFPTAQRVVWLLSLGLLILVFVERKRLFPLKENILLRRWFTWSIIGPIYVFSILSGLGAITILVLLLSIQGLREYSSLVELPQDYRNILLVMGITAAPMAALSLDGFHLLAPLLLIIATLQPLLFGNVTASVRQLAFAVLGWGYIAWFLAHLILIYRDISGGPGIIIAIGVAVALSDIWAFTVGKAFGKHKMSPRLSPNKTLEGAIGNFLGAYLGVALMSFSLPDKLFALQVIALPMLIGVGSIWGDLVESAIKREFQVKDAGSCLPGFGGILDRIDSLIIVVPIVYYFLRFMRL